MSNPTNRLIHTRIRPAISSLAMNLNKAGRVCPQPGAAGTKHGRACCPQRALCTHARCVRGALGTDAPYLRAVTSPRNRQIFTSTIQRAAPLGIRSPARWGQTRPTALARAFPLLLLIGTLMTINSVGEQ